jgi:hypothetical protein
MGADYMRVAWAECEAHHANLSADLVRAALEAAEKECQKVANGVLTFTDDQRHMIAIACRNSIREIAKEPETIVARVTEGLGE